MFIGLIIFLEGYKHAIMVISNSMSWICNSIFLVALLASKHVSFVPCVSVLRLIKVQDYPSASKFSV